MNEVQARQGLRPLRDFLEELLTQELGSFTTTNAPAIWVEPPFMFEREEIVGIAVVISRYERSLRQQHVVSAHQATQQFDWEVVIRNYDKSAEGMVVFDSAIAKIRRAFSQFREIVFDFSEDVFPQVRYLLGSSRVINLQHLT